MQTHAPSIGYVTMHIRIVLPLARGCTSFNTQFLAFRSALCRSAKILHGRGNDTTSANNVSRSISLRMDRFSKAIGLAHILPLEDKDEHIEHHGRGRNFHIIVDVVKAKWLSITQFTRLHCHPQIWGGNAFDEAKRPKSRSMFTSDMKPSLFETILLHGDNIRTIGIGMHEINIFRLSALSFRNKSDGPCKRTSRSLSRAREYPGWNDETYHSSPFITKRQSHRLQRVANPTKVDGMDLIDSIGVLWWV